MAWRDVRSKPRSVAEWRQRARRRHVAEDGGPAFDASLVREKAGLYLGLMVLVLLFGQQGWLLWHQSRMMFAWALSSTRLPSWNLHLGECILRRHAD